MENPRKYLDFNFLLYDFKAPYINEDETKSRFVKFKHNKFIFKLYDKSLQESLQENLLRVEIVLKSNHLSATQIGIVGISDLTRLDKLENLKDEFIKRFDKFVIADNRHNANLSDSIRNKIGNRLEPSFWKNKKGTANITRDKNTFRTCLADNNLLQTKSYFDGLIEDKFMQLFMTISVCKAS